MAVFRSDQAQVTFAAEAAQGGDFERLGASVDTSSYLYISANPGDLSITVAAGAGYRVGDFIRIGNTANAANATSAASATSMGISNVSANAKL